MSKKIWQKNNPKLALLNDREAVKKLNHEEFTRYVQADVNSQLAWIMTRSCKGIPCNECYIKKSCKTKKVSDSQELAGAIIKTAINKGNLDDNKNTD